MISPTGLPLAFSNRLLGAPICELASSFGKGSLAVRENMQEYARLCALSSLHNLALWKEIRGRTTYVFSLIKCQYFFFGYILTDILSTTTTAY